ncbi:glycine receptor subunit alpha-2-like isoform X2 [Lineus longissimus]|uniref:glycine receptor subunit alpha-2-like isoform X2 n=1 Tax=Lineus longissimus TaxID=88925 RepID=UPI002B4D88FC
MGCTNLGASFCPWLLLAVICIWFVPFATSHAPKLYKSEADRRSYHHMLGKLGDSLIAHRPMDSEDSPTVVTCDLFINSFDSVIVESMDYAIQVYIRQTWKDSRLRFDHMYNMSYITLDSRLILRMWVPDLFFQNEKAASFHSLTIPNRLMRIHSDGTVLYSQRISLRLTCPMNLQKFPLDKQVCAVKLESYGYTTDEMIFRWRNDTPLQMQTGMELPQFTLVDHKQSECKGEYITGNFTCLKASFYLERKYGYYVVQTYLPSLLIVCVSWVSFWINIDAVPARISLGVLTVLTMTTQSIGLWMTLPQVSYIKAIDAWMAICVVFVFCAMVEFAIVNTMARVEIRRMSVKMRKTTNRDLPPDAFKKLLDDYTYGTSNHLDPNSRNMARMVDKVARYCFPSMFIAFNLVYWIVLVFDLI